MNNYNQISGSNINLNSKLMFKEFDHEKFYLGFLRSDETWGSCALINITLPPNTSISSLMASYNTNVWSTTNSFVDKSLSIYDQSQSYTQVKLYKTTSSVSDFNTITTNYQTVKELSDISLTLLYINSNWCVLKGLPNNYRDFINNSDGSKYYIVTDQNNTYPPNPSSLSKMVKISEIESNSNVGAENVKLVLSSPNNSTHTSRYDTIKINNLTKRISTLGEMIVDGLSNLSFGLSTTDETTFEKEVNSEYSLYINPSNNTAGYYFYLTDANNKQISPNLFLQGTNKTIFNVDSNGNRYISFKYKISNGESYLKVVYKSASNTLAIFNESIENILPTFSNATSDNNPPSLRSDYLNNIFVDNSFFDVKNLIKIKKNYTSNDGNIISDFSFVKELKSTDEKNEYLNTYGFNTTDKSIQTVNIYSTGSVARSGNIRSKPNGTPYLSSDKRLYVWSNNFVIGDRIQFKSQPNSSILFPLNSYLTITSVDIINGYIGFDLPIGVSGIIPSELDSDSNPQITLTTNTNVISSSYYAVCNNLEDALKYGMTSVMVDIQIGNGINIYDGIYRQLVICHDPKYMNANTETICTDNLYTENLFNDVTHSWNLGTVVYVSNKQPLYRKYITNKETLKLII